MGFFSFLGNILGNRSADRRADKDRAFAQQNYDQQLSDMLGWHDNHMVRHQGVGIDDINRAKDLRDSQLGLQSAFNIMGDQYGMTPQEIAGSPVPGGTSTSGSSTLGNNTAAAGAARAQAMEGAANRQNALKMETIRSGTALLGKAIESGVSLSGQNVQKRGQDIAMSQTQIQSETQKITSKILADASITSSAISADAMKTAAALAAEASKYSTDTQRLNVLGQLKISGAVSDAQIAKLSAETGSVLAELDMKRIVHDERWQKLFSSMSAENVVASALAVKNGLDIQGVLKGEDIDPAILDAFATEVLQRQSQIYRELEGAQGQAPNLLQGLGQVLGGSSFGGFNQLLGSQ